MASCYDCIHYEACSDAGDAGFSSLKEDVSKCKHFKNYDEDNYRADYFCADGTPKERGGEK